MKILVGVPDPAPGGFHWTVQGEMLTLGKLVCRSHGCGCDRSWNGTASHKASTLARVIETPPCFNLRPELAADDGIAFVIALADRYPVGTLLRATYNWRRGPCPQDLIQDDPQAFLAAWDITVVGGPN